MKTTRWILACALLTAAACADRTTAPDAARLDAGGGLMGSGTRTDPAPAPPDTTR
jgi:hypothetical protein